MTQRLSAKRWAIVREKPWNASAARPGLSSKERKT
jgi:hypothetical protein